MNRNLIILILMCAFMQCKQESAESHAEETPSSRVHPLSEDVISMWVGSYTRNEGFVDGKGAGVYFAELDPTSGHIKLINSFDAGINPSYLVVHPYKKFLYLVNETGGNENDSIAMVRAYEVDSQGNAKFINKEPVEGQAPCFISVNRYGSCVYIANYVSGNISMFPIKQDGSLGPIREVYQFSGKGPHKRQESSHAHQILEGPDARVYATDLGTDNIHIYLDEGGRLKEDEIVKLKPSSGPRHIAFTNQAIHMYVLNELSGTIDVYGLKQSRYDFIQSISTLESRRSRDANSAHIVISANNRFLYASNRGEHNNIAIFSISQKDGSLKLIGHQDSMGKIPRNFAIDPSGRFLIVANQDSDQLVSFRIDENTGLLSDPIINNGFKTPVCIAFM